MINISELLNINKKIILASRSPRRKLLLEQLGFAISIMPADIDEDKFPNNLIPSEIAKYLAAQKARAVLSEINEPAYVISADTIVVLDNTILNKPNDTADAEAILTRLSGRTHTVYTGLTIAESGTNRIMEDVQSTEVTFRDLSIAEIRAYIATGSPMDKAGAYGIQDDFGAVFVSNIKGCYYNIVGLPLEMLYSNFQKFRATDEIAK